MDEAFEGINIELIIDDVAGMAGSTKDHDEELKRGLERTREKSIYSNKEKCHLYTKAIPCIGHILSQGGMKSDLHKLRAIREMPAPISKDKM